MFWMQWWSGWHREEVDINFDYKVYEIRLGEATVLLAIMEIIWLGPDMNSWFIIEECGNGEGNFGFVNLFVCLELLF